MKLEVGMYVRTEEGLIGRIESITLNLTQSHYIIKFIGQYSKSVFSTTGEDSEVVKASHNIIDLLKPCDLMYVDISPDDCGGIVVPRVAETLNQLDEWKKRFKSGECILKGVVTIEQLMVNEFRVGDSDG